MKEFILMQILRPTIQRVGVAVGAYFTSQGMASDDVGLLVAAAPVIAGWVVDLVTRKLF